ncbi:adenine deaminase C-terminal domain-containing protein [Desulfoscipio gibsoniae]|uniref:adenine deaminase n=1 Tax=Desulfoscipio gibsoniae DSM 7213 TaxID=767817 RepID=R4KK48_9FIRM|nr:adenine deaminase C-terminal domain-containing protein [Desulfoscipio gibsoniae]AGL00930.1 adenine deaminase [Desulfoscipio gibsoniae DSM 7213]
MNMEEYKDLIQVPLGRVHADKVINNARIINTYTGKVQSGLKVAIKGSRIAYVGTSDSMVGEETEVIDATGMFLAPGYIDPHGHTDFGANPITLVNEILPRGTTAIMTDTKSLTAALGVTGIQALLDMTEQLPLKFFYAVTAANPIFPHLEGEESLSMEEYTRFINHPRVLAVGELVSWVRAIDLDETVLSKLNLARRLNKRIEGHGAGCSPETLNALINVGITSCHESITPEEIQHRINLGIHAMLRHGSIRSDLEALSRVITMDPELDTRWMMLTPDCFSPGDILTHGYMVFLVEEAIRCGVPPVKAIQMATINPAQYLGIDRVVGGIGPSRYADILFLEHPSLPAPVKVMVNGEIVAENGKLIQHSQLNCPRFHPGNWRSGRVPSFKAAVTEHFLVKAVAADGEYEQVPVIKIVNRTITKLDYVKLPVKSGELIINDEDILKISMLHINRDRFATAFMKGYGASIGGLATSTAHDHHTPFVIGNNEDDMALAFNRMMEIGGGLVLVDGGQIKGECPMVIGGIMSNRDMGSLNRELKVIEQYLMERGCKSGPLITLDFLAHTGVPFIRITPSGLYDVRSKEILFS